MLTAMWLPHNGLCADYIIGSHAYSHTLNLCPVAWYEQAAKAQAYVFNPDLDMLCACYTNIRFLHGALRYSPGRAKAVIGQLRPAVKIFRGLMQDTSLTLSETEYVENGLLRIEPYDKFLRCVARVLYRSISLE